MKYIILINDKKHCRHIFTVLFKHGFVLRENRIKDVDVAMSYYIGSLWKGVMIGYYTDRCINELEVCCRPDCWEDEYSFITLEDFSEKYLKPVL